MKIALDAMGGDNAPRTVIEAAAQISREEPSIELELVGKNTEIEHVLSSVPHDRSKLSIVHAEEKITMADSATAALRQKKDSSVAVTVQLHKQNEVGAIISAGNTGAVVATSLVKLGRLKGISRPGIATIFPTVKGFCVIIDVGANSECKPRNLLQFGLMGSVYAQHILNTENPKVGLLNIGEERVKGNDLSVETYELLEKSGLHFTGNVEGRDILNHAVDVVICDGFVGNVLLKFSESLLQTMKDFIKHKIVQNVRYKIGGMLVKPLVQEFSKSFNYEEYGGAPLLGLNGTVIICHGSSSVVAICNAIKVAHKMINVRINEIIKSKVGNLD